MFIKHVSELLQSKKPPASSRQRSLSCHLFILKLKSKNINICKRSHNCIVTFSNNCAIELDVAKENKIKNIHNCVSNVTITMEYHINRKEK